MATITHGAPALAGSDDSTTTQQFFAVDAVTGSGKTTAATNFAVSIPTTNFCFVMPTKKLIINTVNELKQRHPEAADRISVFYAEPFQGPVTGRITEFVKTVHADQGCLLFITHEAFLRLPHWHLKKHWHLIVDEVFQATYGETFTLHEHRLELLDLLRLIPYDSKYSRVEPTDNAAIRSTAINAHGDQITAFFASLSSKLVDSSFWRLFVDTKQFEQFTAGRIAQIELHGLLHPSILNGSASVTLMAANFRESLMFRHFSNLACQFKPHKRIVDRLRYRHHENGPRLVVMYFTERRWSKSLRDLTIEIGGERGSVGDFYLRKIKERFGDRPHLWIANNDIGSVLDGVRLPNVPHGLNSFQGYHQCAIVSALNPSEGHGAFLQAMAQIDERQVRRALLSQVAYQSLGRGSLRDPDADGPFLLIVPDRDTAEDVAAMYPGCQVSRLSDTDPVPAPKKAGRKSLHDSAAARAKAAKRRWSWKQDQLESISLLIGNFDSMNAGGFIYSLWRQYRTKSWENQRFQTTGDFFDHLRWRFETKEYASKIDNYLCSPTWFVEAGKGHTLANVSQVMGVAIDLDSTEMTPDDVACILHEVEMMIVSSWSHIPDEDPCFRIYVPTTTPMTADASTAIRRIIVQRFRDAGFHDKEEGGPQHGVDMGKLHPAALFFLH
jgi:hypothetical protein